MPTVRYDDVSITLRERETVLEGLLRSGINASHSCRSGACHSCLLFARSGSPPPGSQESLKESLAARGYFLSCVARPHEDMEVARPTESDVSLPARVVATTKLADNIARVLLMPSRRFDYKPGQFLNLVRYDGLTRSYSIASLPQREDHLELHVRQIPGGRMSSWLFSGEARGESVVIRGPAGDCFYLGNRDENLLLVGTGTGLAPLYGIVHDALDHGHNGQIVLFHGGLDDQGLYLVDELTDLAARRRVVSYHPCVLRGEEGGAYQVGAIDKIVLDTQKDLAGWRIYLCGDPNLVNDLRKKLFLAGASLKRIHADAFITAPPK